MEENKQNQDTFGLESVQFTIATIKGEIQDSRDYLNVLKQNQKNRPDIRDLLEPRNSNIGDIANFFEARILRLEELIIDLTKQTRKHLNLNILCMNGQGEEIVKNYLPALRKSLQYSNQKHNNIHDGDQQDDLSIITDNNEN